MRPLPENQRADLFNQLAVLEDAGIPPAKALQSLARGKVKPLSERARTASANVVRGQPLGDAGNRSGLFTGFEARLIDTVCRAASPALIYQRLGHYYERKVRRQKQLKARLLLPILILVLAIFIAPLPLLITGKIAAPEYLSRTLGVLLYLFAAIYVLFNLPSWLRDGWLKWLNLSGITDLILIHVPVFGPAHVRRNRIQFLDVVAMLLEAGIPALEAVSMAANTVSNSVIKRGYLKIADRLQAGVTVKAAFAGSRFIDRTALSFTAAGEQAGYLPELLSHYAGLERDRLEHFNTELATWIPRVVYLCILVWLALGILDAGL